MRNLVISPYKKLDKKTPKEAEARAHSLPVLNSWYNGHRKRVSFNGRLWSVK
jgi:hypothetical protein